MSETFQCSDCGATKPTKTDGGVGYAFTPDSAKVCYECCAIRDREAMERDGRITLYLVDAQASTGEPWRLQNWPGTLSIPVYSRRKGRHNIAGSRYDVWFRFNGSDWHGTQYGDNTQLCHCKRLIER